MSSSSSPPAKRPRTEEDTIVRSEIWYKDGSVVLQAANTQFRVHFSLLAAHSTVFSDMYELPQPELQATVDGCPLVEVHDDPEDVKNLLSVLYTPTLLSQTPLPFPIVAALVRLGTKYDFRELLAVGVKRIHLQFPSTLEDYAARKLPTGNVAMHISHFPNCLFSVLRLAIEHDIQCSLPCIYYDIMLIPKEKWVNGIKTAGTISILRPPDLATCLLGSEKLARVQFQDGYICSWMHKLPNLETCENFVVCAANRLKILRGHANHKHSCFLLAGFNPDKSQNWLYRFCPPCQKEIEDVYHAGRERGWEDLPGFFGLPSWGELKTGLP
ncbi:BTB domain-containing protein [Mycena indigotica]|uniref:BTB domain-containing protein n=1 Tax=Mycena indigotica TaxID=2126181 RepID=A0A8H6TAX3_9AGAR|nr:BTB domain-containing protein [Mycena indigotica]KAF7315148.1 BTB domain-containing protein [Mycena indigotica]